MKDFAGLFLTLIFYSGCSADTQPFGIASQTQANQTEIKLYS